ncbi:MAG: hypothetical protein H7236_07720 [Gemmatimonadaceae bacterium]|nr:hypothetical protein [Caulobacter sp.]
MSQLKNTGFADRITAAADAKKAMLAKMKPKPTVTDPNFEQRHVEREAELEAARAARAAVKEAARQDVLAREEAALAEKRADRKERKALSASEQKIARDAKYAARKARQK